MNTLDRPPPAPKPQPLSPAVHSGQSAQSSRRSAWIWIALLVVLVASGIAIYSRSKAQSAKARFAGAADRSRATPVASATVQKGSLPIYLSALGTVTPLNTVTVRSRADGELQKIDFTEGQQVNEGDLLAEIDPRSYQVALEQAEGQLARDQALLENARRDFERYQNAQAAVTQQQIDTAKSTVAQYVGAVQADRASVDNYRLQLSYCRITAPLTGVVGLRLVDQGNLVHASDATGIVVITQEQPIAVVFNVPQENLPQIRKALAAGEKLQVEAYDRALQTRLAVGELLALDNAIDPSTGTVRIKALFLNEGHGLYPNQFVNIRLLVETLRDVTLVPNSAIQLNGQTRFVFVIKADGTVERRTITVSQTAEDKSVVASGLTPGETIVTDGLDRLQDGAKVTARTPIAGGAGAGGEHRNSGDPTGQHRRARPASNDSGA